MSGPISLSDVLTVIPAAQFRSTLVNLLVSLGIPANQWRAGGVASTILTVVSNVFGSLSTLMVQALGANFIDYASGSWLVLLAWYMYGVTAQPATFASGGLTLTNAGGGIYDYAEGQAVFLNSTTGVQYTNAQAFSLGALSSVTFDISATVAGSKGSSAPGAISSLVTAMLAVTCTNALSVVGNDQQTDASLRAECFASLAATSNDGPRDCYTYAILNALNATGAPVNINRILVSPASSTGIVSIYCASPSGAPTAGDLVAAAAAVEALCRPMGVTANVYAVSTVADTDTIVVYAQALPGVSAPALAVAIAAEVAAFIGAYPIGGLSTGGGGFLFAGLMDGIVYSVNPAVFQVTGTADKPIAVGQVLTDSTTIHVNVVPT